MSSLNRYPHIYFKSWVKIENPLHITTLIGPHTSSCMIYNNLVACSCMAYQWCFSHIYFETMYASVKWFIIIWLESPSLMEILHACYVTCDKLQCHTLVVFMSVLRRLASVLWMFSIIIKIHNIQPIHNGSMAFIHNFE